MSTDKILGGVSEQPRPKIALLACSVFEGEIAMYATGAEHIVARRMFDIGLHDRPDVMRRTLQAAVDELDSEPEVEAIVLAYGLCGRGTAGLRAGRNRIVIPRAHDCFTVFMGSKEEYARRQAACPDCYYYSPGWNRARRVPGPERLAALRAELAARFDADEVDFLIENEKALWAVRGHALYVDLGTPDAEAEAKYARGCADGLGWTFEQLHGDPKLLRDLLWGAWDDARFQVVPPGQTLGHAVNEAIFKTEKP